MSTQEVNVSSINASRNLKVVGIIGGAWVTFVIVVAMLAFLPEHPYFSLLNACPC